MVSARQIMFCNACGRQLQLGEQYCTACGQPVGVAPIPRSINRVAHHIQLVGIFWVIYSVMNILASIFVIIFAAAIIGFLTHSEALGNSIPVFFVPMFIVVGIYLFVKSFIGLVAGVGLLQRRRWARILAIVMGALALLNIPFGTALGVYTLWTLFSPESQQEYEGMVGK